MRNFTRIMTVIGLFSVSQLAYSASITDTYATGDTLTAETLTTIKNAINDNDTRINSVKSVPSAKDIVPWLKPQSLFLCDGEPTWSTSGCKTYQIGDIGPGGGIVFYVINGGRSGLEALPYDLGCEDYDPGTAGLEGCPADFNDGFYDVGLFEFQTTFKWGCSGDAVPTLFNHTFGKEIGDGMANTKALVEGYRKCQNSSDVSATSTFAGEVYVADAVSLLITPGGYADWFIPTIATMNEMYNKIGPGQLDTSITNRLNAKEKTSFFNGTDGHYWSSEPVIGDNGKSWCTELSDNQSSQHSRYSYLRLRPVRAF